ILKNLDIQCNPTLKHWPINTFKVLHVGTIEELHIGKQGRNNLGTQVCVAENCYIPQQLVEDTVNECNQCCHITMSTDFFWLVHINVHKCPRIFMNIYVC